MCTLPLSNVTVWEGRLLGTRHRAGLGISEQADVVVVIASEETGSISIAENGSLSQGLSPAVLRQELRDRLNIETDRSVRSIWKTIKNNA